MPLFRPANQQDASAIAHVHVASWRSTYAGIVPDDYLKSLNEADRILLWQDVLIRDLDVCVAELDGEVVGFASAGPIREPLDNCDAELYAVYLLDRAQRLGLGRALLRTLATSLQTRGFRSMMVWVLEQNPAKRFYENLGAIPAATKQIEIDGAFLDEVALTWPDLKALASPTQRLTPLDSEIE